MNYNKLSKQFALACSFTLMVACGSGDSGNPGGVEGAFSSQAVWESGCLDSDRFNLTMVTRYEIDKEAFSRTTRFYSDGACTELAMETVEAGTLSQTRTSDSRGNLDLNFKSIEITPMSDKGILPLNTLSYCNWKAWEVRQMRDVTAAAASSNGSTCWERTPRTVRDTYYVNGNDLYLGVGTEQEKSGSTSRPAAHDESRPYKIK